MEEMSIIKRAFILFFSVHSELKNKNVAVRIAVDAFLTPKIYKLGLVFISHLKEIKEKLLTFLLGVYNS